jgi:ATP-dependent Clp protease ATP-binding subunit ClpC
MAAYRFPILLWHDASGHYTAALVAFGADIAGYGGTPGDAADQLRDFLEWSYRQSPWQAEPDFRDPKLLTIKVDVRPEYTLDSRSYPCSETVALRVPVVTGTERAGLLVASMPTIGVRFNFYAEDDLQPLVTQYVQARFKGATPEDLSKFLHPIRVELDDIVIQVRADRAATDDAPELEELTAVADPLGSRELRNRYSRAWERDDLVATLVETLRKERAPILLLGESGVGKTSVLADAVRRIERDAAATHDMAAHLRQDGVDDAALGIASRRTHRFWLTAAPRLIAGMQYLGMWQQRVEKIISELGTIGGVLCAENLLDVIRTGGRDPGDSIAAFLIPYLQRSELRLVAEATPAELDAARRLLPGLADLFQIVTVPPMSRGQSIQALSQSANVHRQNLKVDIQRGTVETIYRLFSRFMPYQAFPGRATAFLSELFERAAREKRPTVGSADAIQLFIRQTGLPEIFLRDETPLEHEEVVRALHKNVIGQETPCRAAASIVTTFKAGLNDPARPLGVLLFCGPTGVGKTQLAQSLAEFLFGAAPDPRRASSARLIRLDMSEYAGPDAADRFLGSPHTGPSDWIQKIRQQPFCVILLDEIEKASSEIFDVLLAAFDEGRLTDAWGRLTYLRSAVIVMTSNLGATSAAPFGLAPPGAAPSYDIEAAGFFRPEFFNRIDAVVTFDPLSPAVIRSITQKELTEIARREGLQKNNLRLTWSETVIDLLAREGFDQRYGARPLQRAVETLVVTPLAKFLVEHVALSSVILRLDVQNGKVFVVPE